MDHSTIIRAAVVTASDSRTIDNDLSGKKLRELLQSIGAEVVEHRVISDDFDKLSAELLRLAKSPVDLIITTGGTGLGPRDVTPEATRSVIDREAPGIAEALRRDTASKTPTAILSRGVAGTRNGTLIINFPGSPKGAAECFEVIAPILHHAVRMVKGDTKH